MRSLYLALLINLTITPNHLSLFTSLLLPPSIRYDTIPTSWKLSRHLVIRHGQGQDEMAGRMTPDKSTSPGPEFRGHKSTFLAHPESDVNLVKLHALRQDMIIEPLNSILITGITNNPLRTIGAVKITLLSLRNSEELTKPIIRKWNPLPGFCKLKQGQ